MSTTSVLRFHSQPPTTPELHRRFYGRLNSREERGEREIPAPESMPPPRCRCCVGGRRNLLLGAPLVAGLLPPLRAISRDGNSDPSVLADVKFVRPSRARWYQELYAKVMARGMDSYEKEVARYKKQLFMGLNLENKKVLEMGVGTGPNLKYYANTPGIHVYGVDPNKQMEKYARETAAVSGLPQPNFNFIQGVAEALPIRDNSMDAVVGTLVLCSVSDIDTVLMEVKRVLKPGGAYIFIEHVASEDGSLLSLQNVLDPLQQFVADGCHLARETGKNISVAGFSDLELTTTSIPHLSITSPHVYGVACK